MSKNIYGEIKSIVYETAFLLWFENFEAREEIHELMKTIDPDLTTDDIDVVRNQYL